MKRSAFGRRHEKRNQQQQEKVPLLCVGNGMEWRSFRNPGKLNKKRERERKKPTSILTNFFVSGFGTQNVVGLAQVAEPYLDSLFFLKKKNINLNDFFVYFSRIFTIFSCPPPPPPPPPSSSPGCLNYAPSPNPNPTKARKNSTSEVVRGDGGAKNEENFRIPPIISKLFPLF